MSVTAIHLHIHGLVQRVGYRNWAEETAREAGLSGWVRNLTDGTVEMVLCGESSAVARMHHLCENGPTNAHVTRVDINIWSGETPVGFRQLETPEAMPDAYIQNAL